MKKQNIQLFMAMVCLLYASGIMCGDRSNARSTGMGFSSMVSSTGLDAYGINPANYDYRKPISLSIQKKIKPPPKSRWEFSVLSVGGGYGSDSSIAFYNNYLKYLSVNRETFTNLFSDIASVLNFRQTVLPAEKTQVNYDFELQWLAVNFSTPKIGAVNFIVSDRVGLNTNVNSRDEYLPLTFGLTYNPNGSYNLTDVKLNQSEAIAWWIRKYNIGYAKQFDFKNKSGIRSISVGFSAGLVHGFGNVITYESKLDISTWGIQSINGVNHIDSTKGKQDFYTKAALTDFFRDYGDGARDHFTAFPKPAGTGYSFDVGLAMQIGTQWRIAASVTDIGKITWDYNTFINNDNNYFAYYDFNVSSSDPTYNRFVNDLEGLDTRDSNVAYDTDMPTKYRAGLMFQPSDKFLIEANWVKGVNNLPGNTEDNIISLGAEYFPVYFLPFRTGVSVGGPGNFYISLGMGVKLKNFTFDVGTHGLNQLITDKRFSVALSTKVIL
jgi:hypothetical protein